MIKVFCSHRIVLTGLMITLVGLNFSAFWVSGSNSILKNKISEVRKKINRLKNQAVTSIQSEDGDVIDCIDIYKQPAFDHPALKNHIIQMAPSYDPTTQPTQETTDTPKKKKKEESNGDLSMTVTSQIWRKNGSCPQGTIPIRRLAEKALLKANSLKDFGKKQPGFSTRFEEGTLNLNQPNRSVAILLTEGYSYSGVKADIKVWNPFVESDDEYSTSQISLKSGPYYNFESLEAGWAVNPSVYGDTQTRLFTYWTVDASKKTGCFDAICPGFVQTNSEVALGAAIYPLSVPFGLPYQITLYIFKDPATNNWWVQYGERINLGYWPQELFTLLLHGNAETAQWGGEVYSSKLGHPPHTRTGMGSGRFPEAIFGNSGTMKRMRIRENSPSLKFPEWVSTYADEYFCYRTYYVADYIEDPELYYGGPGQNPVCP